jgi:hypothetical protein
VDYRSADWVWLQWIEQAGISKGDLDVMLRIAHEQSWVSITTYTLQLSLQLSI